MMKTQRIKMFTALLILTLGAFGSACSTSKTTAQKTEGETKIERPRETPTPYKPLKRVSRDVIKTESKDEAPTVKK